MMPILPSKILARTPLSSSSGSMSAPPMHASVSGVRAQVDSRRRWFTIALRFVAVFAIGLFEFVSVDSNGAVLFSPGCLAAAAPIENDQSKPAEPVAEKPAEQIRDVEKPDIPANANRIPSNLLTGVRDRTRGIRAEERDAYYSILAQCRRTPANVLVSAATEIRNEQIAAAKASRKPFSQFLNVIKRPEEFRGEPITVRGYLRELRTYDAGENPFGLATLHEGWLYSEDSQGNPWVVVANETTSGMPQPERGAAVNDIVVTGYFFKLWSYSAANGEPWGAPLILANKIEYRPATPTYYQKHQRTILTTLFLVGFLVFVAGVVWLRYRDQQARRTIVSVQPTPVFSTEITEPDETPE